MHSWEDVLNRLPRFMQQYCTTGVFKIPASAAISQRFEDEKMPLFFGSSAREVYHMTEGERFGIQITQADHCVVEHNLISVKLVGRLLRIQLFYLPPGADPHPLCDVTYGQAGEKESGDEWKSLPVERFVHLSGSNTGLDFTGPAELVQLLGTMTSFIQNVVQLFESA